MARGDSIVSIPIAGTPFVSGDGWDGERKGDSMRWRGRRSAAKGEREIR